MIIAAALLVILIFLLLTEILTVNIILADEKILEFNLMIFALRLKFDKQRAEGRGSKRKRPDISALGKFIFSLARVSDIRIRSLSIPLPNTEAPDALAIAKGFLFTAISAFIGFAKENADFFSLKSINFNRSEHNNLKLEASVSISLLRFLTRLIPFLISYYAASGKNARGRFKNGRKQNERID